MIISILTPNIGITAERRRCPGLIERPLVLVDTAQKILSVSEEAALCGISVGQALSGAKILCPILQSLPYDTDHYEQAMGVLWDVFAAETSCVEPISPELCYIELPDNYALERTHYLATQITPFVPLRAGIARTKVVARMASLQARHTVTSIPIGDESRLMARVPISRAITLDQKILQQLERLGLVTFSDVLRIPLQRFPVGLRKTGYLLRLMAVGDDNDPICPSWPPRTITSHFYFDAETVLESALHAAIDLLCEKITTELILTNERTKKVLLTLSLEDGCCLVDEAELRLPVSDPKTLSAAAIRLLERLPIDQPITSISLTAAQITRGAAKQLTLLDARALGDLYPHERDSSLDAAIFYLKQRFGERAVVTGEDMRAKRRINLWTCPLGLLLSESVQVYTDALDQPMRYLRKSKSYNVARIANRWRETQWNWGETSEATSFRVETDPSGIYDLEHRGAQWRLTGAAD